MLASSPVGPGGQLVKQTGAKFESSSVFSLEVAASGHCLVASHQLTFPLEKSWFLDTVLWYRFSSLFSLESLGLWTLSCGNRFALPFSSESRGFWTLLCGIASVYLTFRKVVVSARYLVASLQFTFLFASYGFWTPVQ